MALTRAQLLAGNQAQGYVLPGQVQGVSQGAGVLIAANGQISVDASTVTGLMKLNNPLAYNSYVWPNVDGAAGTFLTTDGAGNLTWDTIAGSSVVIVSPIQPPATEGVLWYDCNTGYLKVYQTCVSPPGWTNVAEPGLPVEPASTSANPNFTGGTGVNGNPYRCTVTTVASGSSIFIVNKVTVTGLAPYQFVPIVDLNATANGGRFHFTNNYADATGSLTFETVFIDLPPSLSGTSYTAAIRVGYATVYINSVVNIIDPITLLTPGSIAGNPRVGQTLTYTLGTATGGVTPLNYNWIWKDDLGNTLQTGGPSYIIQPLDLGRTIYVQLIVSDSAVPPNSVSGDTNSLGPVVYNPIPSTDWNPTPADGMDYIPGGQSGTYTGPGLSASSTGCVVLSVNGAPYDQGPQALATGDTLAIEWDMSSTCGGAPSGTVLTGTLTDGINTNEYTVTVDRLPASFGFNALTDVQPSSQHTSSTVTISDINTAAYVTLGAANTAPSPLELTKDGGTTWFTVPAAPSTSLTVNNGDNIQLRFTTGSTLGQLYTGIINIGDGDNVLFTASSPGFRVTNAVNPVFPNTVFNPSGGPNAAPVTVNIPAQNLYGRAQATWADSPALTPLNTTGALLFQVNGGGYSTGPTNVIDGDTVDICWDLALVDAAADGAVLSGALTDGTYTNSYNLTIDRATDGYDFADLFNQLLNTPVVSNTVAPVGFNVPIQLTYTPGAPDTLTVVEGNIGGGGFNAVPTAVPGLTVIPGQNIQLRATTGINYTTPYNITTTLGTGASANDLWTVTTGSTAPLVVTPSITSPLDNATGVATTVNVTGSAYINQNGAGTQASSDWQIYKANSVQPKTSAIINVSTGSGNTQVKYSERFVTGTKVNSIPTVTNGVYYDLTNVPNGRRGPMLAFDGSTTTNYSAEIVLAQGVAPMPTLYTGWYPTVPLPFGTSVEVWGTGTVRVVVDGVAGSDFILTPNAWNILRIGSGNLEAIEWKAVNGAVPFGILTTATISLNAVRVDGVILTDSQVGQQSYSSDFVTGTKVNSIPTVYNVSYSDNTNTGSSARRGPMLAFDGSTTTNYSAEIVLAQGVAPMPTLYTGWYPTVPLPFGTSVEVWGTGTIRTVVNGVPGADFTLTPGVWNNINIGSGNLEAIEWKASNGPVPFGIITAATISLNAVRIDGVILTDASLGQTPYSQRFVTGTKVNSIPTVTNGVYYDLTNVPNGRRGPMLAFDGSTTTTYSAEIYLAQGVAPMPTLYTGWYPTLPISFGTSVEVWGTGTVRTVVNGVPGADYILSPGTWNVLNIGSGNLEAIEWKAVNGPVPFGMITGATISLNAVRVDGVILTDRGTNPTTVLTLSNNTNLSNFAIGDTVREINAGGAVGDATGVITGINSATPSITVSTTAGTWTVGSSIENVSGPPVDPGPPTTSPPDPLVYTQIVDVTGDTTNFTSYPLVGLANNSIFYARVQYNSNLIVTSSGFSAWSKFTTV